MITLRTMRWLDDVIGGALCSGFAWISMLGHRHERIPKKNEAILFIGLAEMGSVILTDPAMRRARDIHRTTPHFLIFRQNRESLSLTGTISPENIFSLRTDNLILLAIDIVRFMAWSRRRRIVIAIDTDPCSNFSALLALLSGAVSRAGLRYVTDRGKGRAALFNCGTLYRPDFHMAQNLVALTEAALAPASNKVSQPLFPTPVVMQRKIQPAERLKIQARLQEIAPDFNPSFYRIVLVNPNVGDLLPQRRWPHRNYVATIDGVLREYQDIFVFLLGARSDALSVATLEKNVGNGRCRSIAGEFNLAELPALFACSVLLLSSDSGPAHFAAVTSLPVIALFGPEAPARYRPLGNVTTLVANIACSPCISPENQRQTSCKNNQCMKAISVETVRTEITRCLNRGRGPLRSLGY